MDYKIGDKFYSKKVFTDINNKIGDIFIINRVGIILYYGVLNGLNIQISKEEIEENFESVAERRLRIISNNFLE